jgi:putative acetyltransferase
MTMTADTPTTAPTWAIRPELPIDLDLVHDLHRAAFPGPVEAELVDAIRSSPLYVPEGSLVAVTEDGSVLGHVLLSQVALQPDGQPAVEVLALAPLAVLPPHQGRGIGSALMRAALAAADVRQEPMTVVLGAPAYYGRFGFEPASFHAIEGPWPGTGDAFQVRRRPGLAEMPAGLVVYPPAFSAAGPA